MGTARLGLAIVCLIGIAGIIVWLVQSDQWSSNRKRPSYSPAFYLRQIQSAQRDFRENDRDKNGKADYWRADVAGLYGLYQPDDPRRTSLSLIEISLAAADASPEVQLSSEIRRMPHVGYWYKSLTHSGEGFQSQSRFAVCAYPDTYGKTGFLTYIADERGMIWRRDLGHDNGIHLFPVDSELERDWVRVE